MLWYNYDFLTIFLVLVILQCCGSRIREPLPFLPLDTPKKNRMIKKIRVADPDEMNADPQPPNIDIFYFF
jgi:hypothetical protein